MRERIAPVAMRLGAPLGVGAVLGLIGPFGTFGVLPTAPRLAYWLAVVSANWLLTDAIVRRVDTVAQGRLPAPRLSVPLLGALVAAAPATGTVALANGLSGIGWPEDVRVLFGQVLVLLCAIALPVYTWESMHEQTPAPKAPAPDAAPQADGAPSAPSRGGLALFTARLPGPLEGQLYCLEMQDHYLKVHTSAGAQMILCRMEDATRELAYLGLRVHRSWWVAKDAVAGVEREGQRTFLRLTDTRRVPVGRAFRADLKAAGWL